MARYEHLPISFESIYRAYIDCRKRKRGTINAIRFEADVLEGFFQLAVDLQKGTYQPSRSICFITRTPKLRQTLASYLGHFKHAQTYNLLTSIIERHKWLEYIFTFENNTLHERLKQPKEFKKFRSQWLFFKSRLNNFLLFCKVGKFVELYDEDAAVVKNLFKLNSMESKRGMKDAVGFPERLAQVYLNQAVIAGHCAAWVEQGEIGKHIRQGYVLRLYLQNEIKIMTFTPWG